MKLMPTFSTNKPKPDEIEVSLFGPGRGEAVAVHIGDGEWVLVDSCVDGRTGTHPVVEYLRQIGVDLALDVALVVSSHAHDDHFKGIADLWRLCERASFVCPAALSGAEFRALIDVEEEVDPGVTVSAYREFRSVLEIARARRPTRSGGTSAILRTMQGRSLLTRAAAASVPGAALLALSPSDLAFDRAVQAFQAVMPTAGSDRHVPTLDLNELAVALWIEVGNRRVLLGGDLTNGPSGCGWQAVMGWFGPPERASAYKVAHHGSDNAHFQQMWDDLLTSDCLALVSPYRPGRGRPSDTDIARIKGQTANGYATASTKRPTLSARHRLVAAELGSIAKVSDPWGRVGQVQARAQQGDANWRVGLRGPAFRFV
jgi:Predicted hydrolase (metallo-beta-lactamase superfamily)